MKGSKKEEKKVLKVFDVEVEVEKLKEWLLKRAESTEEKGERKACFEAMRYLFFLLKAEKEGKEEEAEYCRHKLGYWLSRLGW